MTAKKFLRIFVTIGMICFGFAVAGQTPHNVVLTWTDPNNPTGTQYNVYKATAACSTNPTFTKLTATAVSALTFTDTPVTVGSAVCYYVTATNGTQESVPSAQAGATVLPFSPATLTIKVN